MEKNTWGLQFVTINSNEDGFNTHLALNTGDETKTRKILSDIKEQYEEFNSESAVVIDLLDEEDSIVEDYSVSKEDAEDIAMRLGHKFQ